MVSVIIAQKLTRSINSDTITKSMKKCKYCKGTGIAMPIKDRAKAVLELKKRGLSYRQIAKEVGLVSASTVQYYLKKYL